MMLMWLAAWPGAAAHLCLLLFLFLFCIPSSPARGPCDGYVNMERYQMTWEKMQPGSMRSVRGYESWAAERSSGSF